MYPNLTSVIFMIKMIQNSIYVNSLWNLTSWEKDKNHNVIDNSLYFGEHGQNKTIIIW